MMAVFLSLLAGLSISFALSCDASPQTCDSVIASSVNLIGTDKCIDLKRIGTCKKKGAILCKYRYYLPVAVFEIVNDTKDIKYVMEEPADLESIIPGTSKEKGYSLLGSRVKHLSSCPINNNVLTQILTTLKLKCTCKPSSPLACMRSDYLPYWFDNRNSAGNNSCYDIGNLTVDQPAMIFGAETARTDALLCLRFAYMQGANICSDDYKVQYIEPIKTDCYSLKNLPKDAKTPNDKRKEIVLWQKVTCCCPCFK